MSTNKQAAPLPREQDQLSFSELVPFRSKKIRLWRSPIFYFVAVTAIFTVVLFVARGGALYGDDLNGQLAAFTLIVQLSMFYMLFLSLLLVHSYAKTDKSFLYYIFPCVFVVAFMSSSLWHLIYPIFEHIGGGADVMEHSGSFPARLFAAITAPGLREELVKAMPVLLCAAMTVWPDTFKTVPRPIYNLLRVRSPLDGVLMGMASGCAFIFFETGGQYIHHVLVEYTNAKETHGNLTGAFGSALMLLMPRVMGGWGGHMAYAGIFGYFIGLAVVRPRQRWQLLLIGWLISAVIHGAWDSDAPGGFYTLTLIGAVASLLVIACLVKARQLDMSLFGRHNESFGSIVVTAPAGAAPAPFVPRPAPVQPPMQPPMPQPMQHPMQNSPGQAYAPTQFILDVAGVRMPLQDGGLLDMGAQPALAGRGAGIKAMVTRHPTNPNVLGLKNLGEMAWYAQLRDNTVQPIEAQRNLRLAAGMTIDFGAGLIGQVMAG